MQATRFIGREADLFRLEELFRQKQRVITLWGPAGIGKTRLAMRYAELRRSERATVTWCELASARSVGDVCVAVAAALKLPAATDTADLARTLDNWGPRLLVLDNADLATAAVADALGAWIAAAPETLFLITSRERVRVPGELSVWARAYVVVALVSSVATLALLPGALFALAHWRLRERWKVAGVVQALVGTAFLAAVATDTNVHGQLGYHFNEGKSSLINRLKGTRVAKAADEPGITKGRQWVQLNNRCFLLDTPGIIQVTPMVIKKRGEDAWKLGALNMVPEKFFSPEEIAGPLLDWLNSIGRYPVEKSEATPLEHYAWEHRFRTEDGYPDLDRAARHVITAYRRGKMGTFNLELPGASEGADA